MDFSIRRQHRRSNGRIMKRVIFSIAFIILIMTLSGLSRAMVTGECSNCHTVHNSQHGKDMQTGYAESSSAQANLLRATNCLGCHASSESTWYGTGGAPIVYNASGPNYGDNDEGLAAGNFYYTTTASGASETTSRGHSLDCIGSADDNSAPSSDQRTSCGSGCHMPDGLRTNGCESCHFPAHHKGSSSGGWADADNGYYRFLGPVPDPDGGTTGHLWGIRGYEDNDWQKSTGSIDHNEYSGERKTTGYFSINHFCAGCHYASSGPSNCGLFSTITSTTYHKANLVLPNHNTTNWDGYYPNETGIYSPLLPIARSNITSYNTSPSNNVAYDANDTLMCLTCHRAHASPYDKMLRWDYLGSTWATLPNESCKGCHSTTD